MNREIQLHPVNRVLWQACLYGPAAILVLLTIGFWIGDWDRRVMAHLFADGVFTYKELEICKFIYEFTSYPALIIVLSCLAYVVYAYMKRKKDTLRTIALGIVLSLVIGPGLVVNVIFKDHYGRPRPKQVEMFGGEMEFHPVFLPGSIAHARSFPSGHSSMGFIFVAGFLAGLGLGKRWAWWFLLIALSFGSVVGLVRMLQGAHWPSDVLWSFGMVYYSTFVVFYLLGIFRPEAREVRI